MAIDRIGKKGGVGGPQGPSEIAPKQPKETFEVGRTKPAEATAAVSPADRVRSGELDVKQYVELRVNEATRHLEGKLAPADLERVRATLRSEVAHDPAIAEMVRAATGKSPPGDDGDEGLPSRAMLSRRAWILAAVASAACRRREPTEERAAAPSELVDLHDLRFDGAAADGGSERALVVVPKGANGRKFPVVVALHGRGEAVRGAEAGAWGWVRDYELPHAVAALARGKIDDASLHGFADPARVAAENASLAKAPYEGLVVVCPHTPDFLAAPRSLDQSARFGDWIVSTLLPRVAAEHPVGSDVGIDGVSLGGRVSLLVGVAHPKTFRAVGSLQAAIQAAEAPEIAKRAKAWSEGHPDGKLRLLTSTGDPFRPAIEALHEALDAEHVANEQVVVPGPHDYAFNRGPGGIEMLLWHDRVLRGRPSL